MALNDYLAGGNFGASKKMVFGDCWYGNNATTFPAA
jgi:hypothetical protein